MQTVTRTASTLLFAAAILVGFGSVKSAGAPATASGGALVGPTGMTLYTFDKDTAGSGKSVCNGQCATNWPPLMAADADAPMGDYSIVTRDDGKKQWAMKGKPLYYWAKDTKPGDKTGDGMMSVWHTATP